MTYDGTDPDDDGVVESDVDNQSTTTQSLDTEALDTTESLTVEGDRVERVGPQQIARAGLREGLVGHWPLNNLSDGLEDTANDNDISISGSPTVQSNSGAFGAGVRFDGDSYGKISHNGALSVESGAFTISAFIRAPQNTNTMVAYKRDQFVSDSNASYGLATEWGSLAYGVCGAYGTGGTLNNTQSPTQVADYALYHAAMVFDPDDNRVTVYTNGQPRISTSYGSAPTQNDSPIWVGLKWDGSGNIDWSSDPTISDLRIYDRALDPSEIRTMSQLPYIDSRSYFVERIGNLYSPSRAGPVARYDDSKTEPYRLLYKDYTSSGSPVNLVSATEFSADSADWTTVASDIISGYTNASTTETSDYVYDGSTHWVYMTDSTAGETVVFSGSDWSSLSFDSTVLTDEDIGSYRESDGTVHLFAEDKDNQVGVGSDKLAHWVADSPNGSFTETTTALDFTAVPTHTGDPDIEKIDGTYWMFTDNTENHPRYATALYRSDDLYNWELVAEDIKNEIAGDLEVFRTPDGLRGFAELDQGDNGGISLWNVSGPM